MKKLACFILVSALVLLCAAWAEGLTEADFMGVWVNVYDTKSDGANAEMIYLREDHKVFYMNHSFKADETGYGREYVGSWSVNGDCIHIKYGETAESDVYMSDGFLLIPLGGDNYIPYGKAPVWGEEKQTSPNNNNAVSIPVGEYLIGEDIPAGRYTIEVDTDTSVATFEVKEKEKSIGGQTYWLGTYYGGTTANITLKDGNVLIISSKPMKLSPAESLFD